MYTPGPTAEEAARYGLTVEEASGPPVEIWPENLQAHNVFRAMSTQWNHGFSGPTGLIYASLPEIWRRNKIPLADRDQVFDDLRVMEDARLVMLEAARKKG